MLGHPKETKICYSSVIWALLATLQAVAYLLFEDTRKRWATEGAVGRTEWLLGVGQQSSTQRVLVCALLLGANVLLVLVAHCVWARPSGIALAASGLAVGLVACGLQTLCYLQMDAMWSPVWFSVPTLITTQLWLTATWAGLSFLWDILQRRKGHVGLHFVNILGTLATWGLLAHLWQQYWNAEEVTFQWDDIGYVVGEYHRVGLGMLIAGLGVFVAQVYCYWSISCHSGCCCVHRPRTRTQTALEMSCEELTLTEMAVTSLVIALYMQIALVGSALVLVPCLLRRCYSARTRLYSPLNA